MDILDMSNGPVVKLWVGMSVKRHNVVDEIKL